MGGFVPESRHTGPANSLNSGEIVRSEELVPTDALVSGRLELDINTVRDVVFGFEIERAGKRFERADFVPDEVLVFDYVD